MTIITLDLLCMNIHGGSINQLMYRSLYINYDNGSVIGVKYCGWQFKYHDDIVVWEVNAVTYCKTAGKTKWKRNETV